MSSCFPLRSQGRPDKRPACIHSSERSYLNLRVGEVLGFFLAFSCCPWLRAASLAPFAWSRPHATTRVLRRSATRALKRSHRLSATVGRRFTLTLSHFWPISDCTVTLPCHCRFLIVLFLMDSSCGFAGRLPPYSLLRFFFS